jgi:transcriptional regulator with XRE-family HTH domain
MNTPQEMVEALVLKGFTQEKIAVEAGVSQPTVSRALSGKGLSWQNGRKLEEFYRRELGSGRRKADDRRTSPRTHNQ